MKVTPPDQLSKTLTVHPDPTFAVIIPTHNNASTVSAAIASAAACGAAEVIVVDDGSTDGTSRVLQGMDEPWLAALTQAQAGPGAARNAGAAQATTDWIVFLDADDVLLPDALDTFGALAGSPELIRTGAKIVRPGTADSTSLAVEDPRPYPRGCPLPGSFAMTRQLFESTCGYDDEIRYGENSELLMRARTAAAGRCGFSPTVTVRVSWQPAAIRRVAYQEARIRGTQRLLERHSDLLRRDDPAAFADLSFTLARDLQLRGSRKEARASAIRGWRVRPLSPRSTARLARFFTRASV